MEQVNACDDERVVQITDMTLEKSLPWFTRVVNDVTNKGPIESAKWPPCKREHDIILSLHRNLEQNIQKRFENITEKH
ncbi:unnamed protein product, partial [Brenthis ino]